MFKAFDMVFSFILDCIVNFVIKLNLSLGASVELFILLYLAVGVILIVSISFILRLFLTVCYAFFMEKVFKKNYWMDVYDITVPIEIFFEDAFNHVRGIFKREK